MKTILLQYLPNLLEQLELYFVMVKDAGNKPIINETKKLCKVTFLYSEAKLNVIVRITVSLKKSQH